MRLPVAQIAADAGVVGERAVVHERKVRADGERMRVLDRHGRFGRHPGMADRLVAGHRRDAVAGADLDRRTDVLVDLHRRSVAEEPYPRVDPSHAGQDEIRRCLADRDGVASPAAERDGRGKLLLELCREPSPVVVLLRGTEGEFRLARGHVPRVDRHPGRIRATGREQVEHRHDELTEMGFQLRVLQMEADDAAHVSCASLLGQGPTSRS